MNIENKLKPYKSKRDFTKTNEPSGGKIFRNKKPIFVIQKHEASRLHYDFRIEVNGVLKSWAVPKGPSTDPRIKRLAIPTEDHPLEYAEFEGMIPEGEYGGGTMIVWDSGTYRINSVETEGQETKLDETLENGKLEMWLEGKKLKGGYALVRTGSDEKPRWLLIKKNDETANRSHDITMRKPESVLSGKTIEELKNQNSKNHG